MLGPRLADGDERRGLGQAVDVRDRPAELALDPLDRRAPPAARRRSRTRTPSARAARALGGRVRDADQHGRRRAQHRDAPRARSSSNTFAGSTLRRQTCARADRGHGPDERPAVGVEHRQRPQIPIAPSASAGGAACRRRSCSALRWVIITPFGPRRRAARVVDRRADRARRSAGARTSAGAPATSAS